MFADRSSHRIFPRSLHVVFCFLVALTETAIWAQQTGFPSDTPASFKPTNDGFAYERRTAMIPMRDGVKLHTVILVPKSANSSPILLTRTPYNADDLTNHSSNSQLGPTLQGYDNAVDVILKGNYIRVVQDVRGKYGSEGQYVVNRPIRGSQNPTPVDHATDTWDTVDWLVKNVPESNGKVGLLGISYNGFLTLMGMVDPHPSLKVVVPMNPMVDGWLGDDWFHNGAFRQQMMPWLYEQTATRKNSVSWWTSHFDDYDMFIQAGTAGELGRRRGMEQTGFWNKLLAHPSYDSFWQEQAMDKVLAKLPVKVPTMIVHSFWDAEDIYGAPAVYDATEPKDVNNDKVFLVMGPWNHGQMIGDGTSLGALKFPSDTSLYFREKLLAPFLRQYLHDGSPKADIAPVTTYETGTNQWRRLNAWPVDSKSSPIEKKRLHLKANGGLGFTPPRQGDAQYTEYVSDPAKPVPYLSRPIQPVGYGSGKTWPNWLVDDQREASGRTDVLTFASEVLTEPIKISGRPQVNLIASTSGTDCDWVVKLIDVYPDQVAADPKMGGYQLMVSADIFRGRYRESLETPAPIPPNEPLNYQFSLPIANHVFLPGHRLMVQVQSSWFPLYDRNPQKYVDSIFWAKPNDFQKATQRVYHSTAQGSYLQLPVVSSATKP